VQINNNNNKCNNVFYVQFMCWILSEVLFLVMLKFNFHIYYRYLDDLPLSNLTIKTIGNNQKNISCQS